MKIQDEAELLKSLESIQNLAIKASYLIADTHINDSETINCLREVLLKLHHIENHSKDSQDFVRNTKCH